jgi:hypothetical protein
MRCCAGFPVSPSQLLALDHPIRSTTELGQSSVVTGRTPDRSGGRADNLASVFVGPEIREKAQSTSVQIVRNHIRAHTERPRFARSPNRSESGSCARERYASVQNAGMHLLADLGADEYRRKVIGPTARPIRGYGFYHVALAEIDG